MKFFFTLLALVLSINTYAQWTTDLDANTLVSESASTVINTIGTSDGQTYIVYWKQVAAPTNFELRLQLLDAAGNKQLGSDGVLVSSAISMSTFTVVGTAVKDVSDNIYIGVTATNGNMGHVFKMDRNGNHLWNQSGVSFSEGFGIIILPLSTDEAIVSWLSQPNALMQKYNASGSAVWAAPQPVKSGTSKTAPGELFEMPNGDFSMVFHVYNFGVNSTLYAQRYGTDGIPLWTTPSKLSNKTTTWNSKYSVGQDADVIFIGYMGASSTRFDAYLQRINPDGTLPWGINGSDFDINETDFEKNTRIAVSATTQQVWAICNYTNPTQSENGEYVQKFNSETGVRLLSNNAKMLYAIGSEKVHASDLFLVNERPFFLIKSGMDNGVSPTTLQVALLDENGDFEWTDMAKPVATFNANKGKTYLTEPVDGQAVATWIEDKSNGPAIYAQNVVDGALTGLEYLNTNFKASVYPNPAINFANIEINSPINANIRIEIYDSKGQLVSVSKDNLQAGDNNIRVDLNGLLQGKYFYRITAQYGKLDLVGKIILSK
jgi:hypothetical protein